MSSILNETRYTMAQVARLVGVHICTPWRWHLHGIRGRRLPTVLIGGRRFVLARDLEAFLEAANEGRQPNDDDVHRGAAEAGRALDGLAVTQQSGQSSPLGAKHNE